MLSIPLSLASFAYNRIKIKENPFVKRQSVFGSVNLVQMELHCRPHPIVLAFGKLNREIST
jgi:hypothetical protein